MVETRECGDATNLWEQIAGDVLEQRTVPRDWVALNNLSEYHLRSRVKETSQFFHSDKFGVLVGIKGILTRQQVECLQISLYSFFYAYSSALTWEIMDKDSALFQYQGSFCSLNRDTYLGLFGNLYCMRVVATQRFDPSVATMGVDSAAVILSRPDMLSWTQYLEIAHEQPKFLSEVSVRMYQSVAEAIGLPNDEKALDAASDDSIGNSLLGLVAAQHQRVCDDSRFMAVIRGFLELDE